MSPIVVFVGVPGAGKTTVGRAVAERMGAEFVDSDHLVEADVGKPVADIFVEDGEGAFRELERAAVARALARDGVVVSLGGGAVLDPGTRELLGPVPTVWLRVAVDAASKRVGLGVSRPVLLGGVRGRLVELSRERGPLYEEVADIVIDTDELTPDQVADRVTGALADLRATAERTGTAQRPATAERP